MLEQLQNRAILDRLEQARAKSKIKQVDWPDRHIIGKDGKPVPFHLAQSVGYDSTRRTIVLSAGSQSGKTSWLPWWLKREIQLKGTGDYIAVTSSFDLFKLKFLPEVLKVFEDILGWGRFWAGDKIIELKDPKTGEYWAEKSTDTMWGRIILRSAQSLGGLESATAKAACLDEAGQDEFPLEAYRAINRRLALNRGRKLISTTLYNLGWLKSELIDPVIKTGITRTESMPNGAEIDITESEKEDCTLIQYDSIVNPEFSIEEWNDAKEKLPDDLFNMFYRGRISRPRHMIYDCLNEDLHFIPRFEIDATWQRYIGLDFGAVNTVATFWAEDPRSRKLYCYREYKAEEEEARKSTLRQWWNLKTCFLCVGEAQRQRVNGDKNLETADYP